jgi:hypothetical protein
LNQGQLLADMAAVAMIVGRQQFNVALEQLERLQRLQLNHTERLERSLAIERLKRLEQIQGAT